jgi:hypothetical protein
LKHTASSRFWALYEALPQEVRDTANKSLQLLKADPKHPSLHFKPIGKLWSVRVGARYRALGREVPGGIHWFWVGTHAEYDKIVT